MIRLRVVGWDHDRCLGPLRAAATVWEQQRVGVRVDVVSRSGHSFAEEPLSAVAPDVDVVSFDHPFVGAVAAERSLRPLDELLPAATLTELADDAIGLSHDSYAWDGRQWGLAADAACQVSVVRDDLLGAASVPATWADALELAREAPKRVTSSFATHDAMCAFLTVCANHGAPVQPTDERFADPAAALPALAWLGKYARACHPSAFDGWVPAAMTEGDDVVYALLQWGYTNFCRADWTGPRLRFLDIPSAGAGPVGSTLGGAGLGVSAWSAHPEEAAAFAAWATSAAVQRDVVFAAGGQPGSRSVWDDSELDAAAGGFFSGTRATIDAAALRPRDAWWPAMQATGGAAIRDGLRDAREPGEILDAIERIYAAVRREPVSA